MSHESSSSSPRKCSVSFSSYENANPREHSPLVGNARPSRTNTKTTTSGLRLYALGPRREAAFSDRDATVATCPAAGRVARLAGGRRRPGFFPATGLDDSHNRLSRPAQGTAQPNPVAHRLLATILGEWS